MVDRRIESAHTLPSDYYFNPDVYERERRTIFHATWQLAGSARQVASPGDYFTFDIAGEPLLIARDSRGLLRAFYNVCRHRAGPPAEGCGSRKVFRCGYHGWTYDLDGRLLAAPEFEGVEDFRAEEFGLRPVAVEEVAGLVLVNLAPAPSSENLKDLPARFARFDFPSMAFAERRDYIMECNWKVYIDNYLEGYHLPSVHPSLNRELDYSSYATELCGWYNVQASPIRPAGKSAAGDRRYESATGAESAEYFWVFPNWMLNCYPDNISINMVLPLGPSRTLARFEWFFPERLLGTDVPARTIRFSDEIQAEDGRICEMVQKNLASSSYDRGRYSVRQEKGVHHFHRLYLDCLAG